MLIEQKHLQKFNILDYDDTWWGCADITDYLHHCPEPWSDYCCSPDGTFLDLQRMQLFRGQAYQPGWYPTVSLRCGSKTRTTTISVHRVLACVFCPNSTGLPSEQCHVDHIDCCKENYSITNLQIVTPQENKRRAYTKGERTDNIYTVVTNLITHERIYCYSLAEASRVTRIHYYNLRKILDGELQTFNGWNVREITKNEYFVGRSLQ